MSVLFISRLYNFSVHHILKYIQYFFTKGGDERKTGGRIKEENQVPARN